MYTLYKRSGSDWQVLAYCESPTEAAQAMDRDIEEMDDNAEYKTVMEEGHEKKQGA